MAQLVRDVMTPDPVTLQVDAPVREAAQRMRDEDIGNVLVLEGERLVGVVTDRDIVVRGVAERDDMSQVTVGEVCSGQPIAVTPNEDVTEAIARMRTNSVRRVVVIDQNRPVGVLSLGDAAIERDPNSVLGSVSGAPSNS